MRDQHYSDSNSKKKHVILMIYNFHIAIIIN